MPRAHRLRAGVYFYWFARCCPVAWRLAAMLQLLGRYSRPLVECAPMHLNCVGVGVGLRGRAWDSLGLRGVAAGVGACRGGPRPHGTGKHPGALVSLPTPPGGKCTRGASRVLHLTHLSVRRSFSVSREVHVHEKHAGITGESRPRLPYCRRRSHSRTSGGKQSPRSPRICAAWSNTHAALARSQPRFISFARLLLFGSRSKIMIVESRDHQTWFEKRGAG